MRIVNSREARKWFIVGPEQLQLENQHYLTQRLEALVGGGVLPPMRHQVDLCVISSSKVVHTVQFLQSLPQAGYNMLPDLSGPKVRVKYDQQLEHNPLPAVQAITHRLQQAGSQFVMSPRAGLGKSRYIRELSAKPGILTLAG